MCWKSRDNSRNDTAEIMPGRCRSAIATGQRHVQHSGTPQDGTEAHESISFALDGVALKIDLSNDNAEKLRDIFAPYIAAARRGDGQRARRPQRMSTGSTASRADVGPIREWAAANGFTVSARGRISAEVMEAYTNRGAGDGAAAKPGLPKVTDPFMVSFT